MDTQNNSAKDAKRIALGDHDNKYSASVSIVDYVGELIRTIILGLKLKENLTCLGIYRQRLGTKAPRHHG
jgi:hypothetical protein